MKIFSLVIMIVGMVGAVSSAIRKDVMGLNIGLFLMLSARIDFLEERLSNKE